MPYKELYEELENQNKTELNNVKVYKIIKREYYELALKNGYLGFQNPLFATQCDIESERDKYESSFRSKVRYQNPQMEEDEICTLSGNLSAPSFSYCFTLNKSFRDLEEDEVLLGFNLKDIVDCFIDFDLFFFHGKVAYCCGTDMPSITFIDIIKNEGIRKSSGNVKPIHPLFWKCLLQQFLKGKDKEHENEYRFVVSMQDIKEENKELLKERFVILENDKYRKIIKRMFSMGVII